MTDVAFQKRVHDWMSDCFGETIARDRTERADRFIEEALELAQSTGWTKDRAHALVDYVFDRPAGEVAQEVGGVMVTLAALCNVEGIAIAVEAKREIDRITTPVMMEKIRAKQAAKPTGSALPAHVPVKALPFVMLPIPVEVAKDVAIAHGYDQVVIFARRVADEEQAGGAHLTTFGRTDAHASEAAHFGYLLRTEFFDWQPSYAFSHAAVDVLDERHRQMTAEGWTLEHDDAHVEFELANAAASYAENASQSDRRREARAKRRAAPDLWPWGERWFRPKDRRSDLVRAAALLLAEIERLDRAAKRDEVVS